MKTQKTAAAAPRNQGPAAANRTISPASLIMAAGAVLSCMAFLFAPAGNQAAQIFAAAGLVIYGGLFLILEKFNY